MIFSMWEKTVISNNYPINVERGSSVLAVLLNNDIFRIEQKSCCWSRWIILYLVLIILPLQVLSTFVFSFPSNVTKKTQPTREQLTRNENENKKKNLCSSVERETEQYWFSGRIIFLIISYIVTVIIIPHIHYWRRRRRWRRLTTSYHLYLVAAL